MQPTRPLVSMTATEFDNIPWDQMRKVGFVNPALFQLLCFAAYAPRLLLFSTLRALHLLTRIPPLLAHFLPRLRSGKSTHTYMALLLLGPLRTGP